MAPPDDKRRSQGKALKAVLPRIAGTSNLFYVGRSLPGSWPKQAYEEGLLFFLVSCLRASL